MSTSIIHTVGDGVLAGVDAEPGAPYPTTLQDVAAIAKDFAGAQKAVIHVHGGLVSKAAAIGAAQTLAPFYASHGLDQSAYFVWESQVYETIPNNLREVFNQALFQSLLKILLKWAGGKIVPNAGGKGVSEAVDAEPLTDQQAAVALANLANNLEPLAKRNLDDATPVTTSDKENFEAELRNDNDFLQAFDSIMLDLGLPQPEGKAAVAPIIPGGAAYLSEDVKNELRAQATPGGKGFFDPVTVVAKATSILVRIVSRYIGKRDHGPWATIVEEIAREFYLAHVGTVVWGLMKNDTADTFAQEEPGKPRGGREFVAALGQELLKTGAHPRISVVGHSAGAIFACHLLLHVDKMRQTGVLPADFTFDRLIFMAAAVRTPLFAEVLAVHAQRPLFKEFRMFTMSDQLESAYWEVPHIYPRSLLYLISGMLEDPEYDMELVGMQRYHTGTAIYSKPYVVAVRSFLAQGQRLVWSLAQGGDGLNSDADRHGGFCDTGGAKTSAMLSVVHFLQ